MPEFSPGESKTAVVTMSNPKPKAFDYVAELYMGTDLALMAQESFHLEKEGLKDISLPVTMPLVVGVYPVYLGVFSNGQFLEPLYHAEDVSIAAAEPSALLISYQRTLAECIEDCSLGVPLIMLPVYGIQNPCTGIGLMKGLMITEAINIGMISSAGECYFVGAVMYFSDGTTIVPYWWPCPWCPERFRNPEQLAQHKEAVHADILATKATIDAFGLEMECADPPWCDYWDPVGVIVGWRNDSPFSIRGHVEINRATTAVGNQDALLSPGQRITVYFKPPVFGYYITATLTLVGEPLPGLVLDTETQDLLW